MDDSLLFHQAEERFAGMDTSMETNSTSGCAREHDAAQEVCQHLEKQGDLRSKSSEE